MPPKQRTLAKRQEGNLRRRLYAIRFTLLHPQFLAYRHERARYEMTARYCTGRVLDLGCGRQYLRQYLNGQCEYVGLDHPDTGAWYESRPAVLADASCLPFADNSFETVVCLEVLEHLPRPERALAEIRRVLKSGGQALISTPFLYPIHDAPADYQRWTVHGLESITGTAGLQMEKLQSFGTPVESGALLFNLGWAWQAWHSPVLTKVVLSTIAAFIVPIVNLIGLLASRQQSPHRTSRFATGYICVLRSKTDLE